MGWAILLGLVAACSFTHGDSTPDGGQDAVLPDAPVVPTWAIDPLSGKAVPATAAQWNDFVQAFRLRTSAPDHLWLMQESSGDLQDAIGPIALSAVNGPSYARPLAGWSRMAAGTVDTSINQGFVTSAIGDLSGTSYLLLVYLSVLTPPAAERSLFGIGANGDHRYVAITPTPLFEANGIGLVPTTGTVDPKSVVHPVILEVDATHQTYVVYTDEEQLAVTWVSTAGLGNLVTIGSASVGAADARYLYGALWSGSQAELSAADIKALLLSLGWTVSGY